MSRTSTGGKTNKPIQSNAFCREKAERGSPGAQLVPHTTPRLLELRQKLIVLTSGDRGQLKYFLRTARGQEVIARGRTKIFNLYRGFLLR